MKKFAFVFLTIVVFASLFITASAGTYEDLTYDYFADGIVILKCDETAFGTIMIPSEIEGLPVVSIGEYAFSGCEGIEEVILPSSLTSIEDYAFYQCPNIKSITIPESVTVIDICALGYTYHSGNYYEAVPEFIIYGTPGSAAETYASDNIFEFKEDLQTKETHDLVATIDEEPVITYKTPVLFCIIGMVLSLVGMIQKA